MAKSKKSPRESEDETREMFIRTSKACIKNYMHFPNVIGVGMGLKFTKDSPVDDQLSVVFYVRQKVKQIPSKKRLPRFVYARTEEGKIDYSLKLRTDVVEMKNLKFAFQSGVQIKALGKSGTITMVFQNKKEGHTNEFYLITCSHVVGDMSSSPPVSRKIRNLKQATGTFTATTIGNSEIKGGGYIDYDIALAQFDDESMPQNELQVARSSITLGRFMPSEKIKEGMSFNSSFPVSKIKKVRVDSFCFTPIPIRYHRGEYQVKNLFKITPVPSEGDSGGLLYDNDKAVGILVGKSEDCGVCHPLEEAFDYLLSKLKKPIRCF